MRHLQRCTQRLETFFPPLQNHSTDASSRPAFFLASWLDREVDCVADASHGTSYELIKSTLHVIFARASLPLKRVWLGSSSQLLISTQSPLKRDLYLQYTLWARCLDMVSPDFELIVKMRPDLYFLPHTTNLGWSGRSADTGQPMIKLFGQQMIVTDMSVFAFTSPYAGLPLDDTLVIGPAAAMRVAVGALKARFDSGAYAAWGHLRAEWLFLRHLQHSNLTIYCMGSRHLFSRVEPCSRCMLTNGTGVLYGNQLTTSFGNRMQNFTWSRADRISAPNHTSAHGMR